MAHHDDIDEVSGVSTTGHEWDGIRELNNPLPKWWLYVFYASIVWSVGYYFVYPSWPMVTDYTRGFLGYSQREAALADHAAGIETRMAAGAGLSDASIAEIQATPELLTFAMANGKAAFGDNCAPCHGSGATGSKGYPNLQDDDWLWGGSLEAIEQTIAVGIRSTSDDTRLSDMPAFGRDELLDKDQIRLVANYVRSLSGLETAADLDLAAGGQVYAENCAACHGETGEGNPELGAPRLSDAIWLYGSDQATIVETVTNSRMGVMPTWTGKLDPITIKSLAVYVHNLGGGQ
ncbi:cytochrome-c oxidase, cbb3-type subunit III [Methylobrevis pamukkalensis]|uniref:Cbb3-type cytochrome c oxidase subunit n=1 Tax=Methylobrevis pamukkalensis TaxID=1439726 RepID=A0A1E3H7S2_9HYPH|nr:cytochrome-c oxidase, cbb3-type subunit III [Methylobrevis pamukkalensis]ODN72354.1 Cbb3-type cytochrome c oxidase subunit FixP [Methylobrevis pamukkalensis]